jgi:poly(hydroxyalkanoate) depolymerase family esterase
MAPFRALDCDQHRIAVTDVSRDRLKCRDHVIDRCKQVSVTPFSVEIDSTRPFCFALQQLSSYAEVYQISARMEMRLSLKSNVEFLRRLPKLDPSKGLAGLGLGLHPGLYSPLIEIADFGSNPGSLRMFAFVPEAMPQPRALVVVLHGCGQTASGYDFGAGWSTLAKHFGFALLMPEQKISNNANGCFNWFSPQDIARGQGEAASIRQMIARMERDCRIDRHRIFVTGLSAGGAMTAALLATYPDVFAAGAVIAGMPFGVAANMREALSGMHGSPARSPRKLGDLVRKASSHSGPWPKLSVWHGSADRVVHPGNGNELVKQWLDLHHLPQAPMSEGMVDGHPRRIWWDADGETMVESYIITDMAHGTPLGIADDDRRYGAAGPFLIEAGISSSYHIAKFFGLTNRIHQPKTKAPKPAAESPSAGLLPKVSPMQAPPPAAMPNLAKVLSPLMMAQPRQEQPRQDRPKRKPRRRGIDVGAVITRALTAAGLMK